MVTTTPQQPIPGLAKVADAPPGNNARRGEAHDDRGTGDAFETLLVMTRGTIARQITSDNDRAAGLMFDANAGTASGDRMSQLTEDYQTAIGQKADRLTDARRGVEARRTKVPSMPGTNDRTGTIASSDRFHGGVISAEDVLAAPTNPASDTGQAPSQRFPRRTPERFDLEIRMAPGRTGQVADAISSGPRKSSVVPPVSGATPFPAAQPGSAGVAEEVGHLLGASRIQESQGARAVLPVQVASDQPSGGGDRRAGSADLTKEQSLARQPSDPRRADRGERTAFDKLIGSLRLRTGVRRSTAQLRLNPPELGRIRVDVRLSGDRLVVGVQAETESARELLSQRADHLKAALRERGIQVDRFDIVSNTSDPLTNESGAGGDAGGFLRDGVQLNPSPRPRVARGDAVGDFDGVETAGTVVVAPTVAGETRLDIRV